MATAMVRAVSVAPFQAITTCWPMLSAPLAAARMTGLPLSNRAASNVAFQSTEVPNSLRPMTMILNKRP